jgi:ABC-type glutathione transport system ATPase component
MSAHNDSDVLSVDGLVVEYHRGRTRKRAVDDVSFTVASGETLGLVGESGSGKTSIGMAVLGLVPSTGGTIRFAGTPLGPTGSPSRRAVAGDLQVVFQDPYSSLNPSKTVGYALAEPCIAARREDRKVVRARAIALLERVGLPADAANRYPAQFSGGQRQRIAIARALMPSPRVVVCDEPVSALDLSVQAEVLNLLTELQRELSLSMLFISHDLAVVRHIAQRLIVLHDGRIVEQGTVAEVYDDPKDPHTQALLAAAPVPDPVAQAQRRQARPAFISADSLEDAS